MPYPVQQEIQGFFTGFFVETLFLTSAASLTGFTEAKSSSGFFLDDRCLVLTISFFAGSSTGGFGFLAGFSLTGEGVTSDDAMLAGSLLGTDFLPGSTGEETFLTGFFLGGFSFARSTFPATTGGIGLLVGVEATEEKALDEAVELVFSSVFVTTAVFFVGLVLAATLLETFGISPESLVLDFLSEAFLTLEDCFDCLVDSMLSNRR